MNKTTDSFADFDCVSDGLVDAIAREKDEAQLSEDDDIKEVIP